MDDLETVIRLPFVRLSFGHAYPRRSVNRVSIRGGAWTGGAVRAAGGDDGGRGNSDASPDLPAVACPGPRGHPSAETERMPTRQISGLPPVTATVAPET